MIVIGVGTGGTVAGVARKIKQKCLIVGVDPFGPILAQPDHLNKTDVTYYDVESIGYDFIPTVLDRSLVDRWCKVGDKDSFIMARRLIRQEGLMCGGSCGTAKYVAIQAVREYQLPETARVVVILPDSVRNYMTKFLSDDWMYERYFMDRPIASNHQVNDNRTEPREFDKRISTLDLIAPMTVQPNVTVQLTLELLKKEGFDQVPVVEAGGSIIGMATVGLIMSMLVKKSLTFSDSISRAIFK